MRETAHLGGNIRQPRRSHLGLSPPTTPTSKTMKTPDEDIADGVRYGFPTCCIMQFVKRGGTANARQAIDYGIVQNKGNPFVPCHLFHFPDIPLWDKEISGGDT